MADRRDRLVSKLKSMTLFVSFFYFITVGMLFLNVIYFLVIIKNPEWQYVAAYAVFGSFFILLINVCSLCISRSRPITVYIHGSILAIIFVTTMGGIISLGINHDSIRKDFQTGYNMTLITTTPINPYMEHGQVMFKCCGVNNYTDWVQLSPSRVIPESCCVDKERCVTANYNAVYQKGCYEAISTFIVTNIVPLFIIVGVVAVLPAVGSILCFILGSRLEQNLERSRNRLLR